MSDNSQENNSTQSSAHPKSLLPKAVQKVFQDGMRNGFKNGTLSLESKKIDDNMMPELCLWITKLGNRVKRLELWNNKLTSKGASQLFDALRECDSSILDIQLSYNQIDDDCMDNVGKYVQDNKYLEKLHLMGNKFTDEGIDVLSGYLMGNTVLKELGLSLNQGITDISASSLIDIAKRSYISKMTLWSTKISEEHKEKIEVLLKVPTNKREISVKSNSKSAAKFNSIF